MQRAHGTLNEYSTAGSISPPVLDHSAPSSVEACVQVADASKARVTACTSSVAVTPRSSVLT